MPANRPNDKYLAQKLVLAVILPMVAGAVNASGLVAVGLYTSHVTGHVARIGDGLSVANWQVVTSEAVLVLAYLFGVMVSTGLVQIAMVRERARHAVPLLLEAAIVLLYASWAEWQHDENYRTTMTVLLVFSMGIQNALVTRAFGAVVRTTHLTGVVTDIGIELMHMIFVLRSLLDGGLRPMALIRKLIDDPQWAQLRTHISVLLSFLGGATLGPFLVRRYGQSAISVLVLVLCCLAIYDLLHGI
ncbi:MAG: DUF1275 domain-containing protein, partial [Deltaproteobacteria bacterium]